MNKFVLKFLLLFVISITILFYGLLFLGKSHKMPSSNEHRFHDRYNHPPVSRKGPPLHAPFFIIISISSILMYVLLTYVDKNFVMPLEQIKKKVKEIDNGSLDVKFSTKSENESIQETYKTLNKMVEGLKEKEKLQNNFIQNLVHDLRAPVIAQERAMDILSEDMKDNPLINGLKENNDAYLNIINSIIESFKLKEIKIEKIEFDLNKLTDTIINALKPAAKEKNIKIINSINSNFLIWADYISLNRILLNLISNSIESIQNGKTIEIKAKKLPTTTIITVQDNGQGINSEDIKNIFNKYISKNNSGKKSVSGLGLSIVKELVLKNYGKIYIDSEVNKYTKFIIELPKKVSRSET